MKYSKKLMINFLLHACKQHHQKRINRSLDVQGKVFEFKNVKNIIRLYSIEVIMPLERFMRRKRRLMTGWRSHECMNLPYGLFSELSKTAEPLARDLYDSYLPAVYLNELRTVVSPDYQPIRLTEHTRSFIRSMRFSTQFQLWWAVSLT